jgi:hypothetical protein
MLQRFSFLWRTGKKLVEIAGAGCASAVVAFLLGNSHEAAAPTPATATNAPAVVRLAPADEEMIRAVRQESASLVAHLRTGPQAPAASTSTGVAVPANAATGTSAAASSMPAKQAKTISPQSSAQPRKEAKVSRPPVAETKPRSFESTPTLAVAPPPAPAVRAQNTTEMSESRLAQASTISAESAQPLGIKPISKWFSDVPRPRVGIGEDASRSM